MTTNDIKSTLKARGITIKAFASQLGVGYTTLRLILSGRNPMSEQLRRHIELQLGKSKEQLIMYKVTLPDEVVERWVPGNLTPKEQQAAVHAVLMDAVAHLQSIGEAHLTPEERARLMAFASATPAPSYDDAREPFA